MLCSHRRDGFSLLELIFALVIFQIGLLGVAGMLLTAQRTLTRAELILRGATSGRAVGDSLLAGGEWANGRSDVPWGTVSWGPSPEGSLRVVAIGGEASDTLAVLHFWPPLSPGHPPGGLVGSRSELP